jgi:hypothetical protein
MTAAAACLITAAQYTRSQGPSSGVRLDHRFEPRVAPDGDRVNNILEKRRTIEWTFRILQYSFHTHAATDGNSPNLSKKGLRLRGFILGAI